MGQIAIPEIQRAYDTKLESQLRDAKLPCFIFIQTKDGLHPLSHQNIYGLVLKTGEKIGRYKYVNRKDMYESQDPEERLLASVGFNSREPSISHALETLFTDAGNGWGIHYPTKIGTRMLIYGFELGKDEKGNHNLYSLHHKGTFEDVRNQILIHTRYLECIKADTDFDKDVEIGMKLLGISPNESKRLTNYISQSFVEEMHNKKVIYEPDTRDENRKMTESMLDGLLDIGVIEPEEE